MPSDSKRLDAVYQHLRQIKAGDYPVIQGSREGGYRIVERPWAALPEPSKLAVLQESVCWVGITNRDQAHILLSEIDPGKITDEQRRRLIDQAAGNTSFGEVLRQASARGGWQENDRGLDR
jgi:hypothetical protein